MKTTAHRIMRDESGNILIIALVLLVLGGLLLGPLLGLMSTGLIAGQVYEKKMAELYAADAGIEDALWKIQHGEIPSDAYNLTVNDKDVWVTIAATDTVQFLANLLESEEKHWVHADWVILGRIPEPGNAEITISWNGSGNGFLTDVGMWLSGNYSYADGQAIPDDDIRTHYPVYTFEQKSFSGGTAFIWTWPEANQANGPAFDKDNLTRTLAFEFTPESTPKLSIAFTMMGRQNVGLSYDGSFNLHKITAIATTDTATATSDSGTQTVVVAHAAASGCGGDEIVVLSWNIS